MKKNTITKWLITVTKNDGITIKEKEVSHYAPINRVLDEVGFYDIDVMNFDNNSYLMVTSPEERYQLKHKMLVSKVDQKNNGFIDMAHDDIDNIYKLIDKHMIKPQSA